MNDRNFYEKISGTVRAALDRVEKMRVDMVTASDDMRSGKYSDAYVSNTLKPRVESLKHSIRAELDAARRDVRGIVDDYVGELREADCLHSEDLNADVQLLNCGVKLTRRDIESLLARNDGNKTMTQLILRYVDENKIDMGRTYHYIGNKNKIADVQNVPHVAEIALKWWEYPNQDMHNKIFGERSEFFRKFGTGEAEKPAKMYTQQEVDAIVDAAKDVISQGV